ncbi:hypothetical protein D3C83_264870 [compost metagenome]
MPGHVGAHGRFDDRARVKRWEEWLSHHHTPSLLGAAVASGVAALAGALIGWYATGD